MEVKLAAGEPFDNQHDAGACWTAQAGGLGWIGAVRRNRERRQPLLDLQIIEKRIQQPQIGIGTLHEMSMERADTVRE